MTDFATSTRNLLVYALPAAALAMPTIPVHIQLPTLYGTQLGLGLAATGTALLVARFVDAVLDPFIGLMSDRIQAFGTRRKFWIVAGAILAAIGLVRLLNPPDGSSLAYLFANSTLLYVGWTTVNVSYLAWGAELSDRYESRTRIAAWRESLGIVGILGTSVAGVIATNSGWDDRAAIGAVAWGTVAFGGVAIAIMLARLPEKDLVGLQSSRAEDKRSISKVMADLKANGPFMRLFGAWILNGLANGIPAALFFTYLEFGLAADARARAWLVLAYFLAAILSMPIWIYFSRRFGKHRVWCGAMIVACIAFLTVPAIGVGGIFAFAIVCVATGMALGADLTLPPAIQADVIDYGMFKSGYASAGFQFAIWSMGTKLALAAAVGVALPGVAALGFDPAAPTEHGVLVLTAVYSLLPVSIKAAAIGMMWKFPLTAERHELIRRRLARQSAGAPNPEGVRR